MRRSESVLDRLLHSRPDEREHLLPYVDRAKALSRECGCSMGGGFMMTALVLVVVHAVAFAEPGRTTVVGRALRGVAIVFAAGGAGKLLGIGIARARLAWLYRQLRVRYHA